MSGEHVMVIPDCAPVRIGDGPRVGTRLNDVAVPFMEVWVDEVRLTMDRPWPVPQSIPDTPYEAYALGEWTPDRFAIRLREDHNPQEMR